VSASYPDDCPMFEVVDGETDCCPEGLHFVGYPEDNGDICRDNDSHWFRPSDVRPLTPSAEEMLAHCRAILAERGIKE